MNSMSMGQPDILYDRLDLRQPITGPNFYSWAFETGLFEGTMRGLFSILFGAGTILLINRLEKTRGHIDSADIYFRRILWLLVFGLINAFIFLWTGDILYGYAICGLVLFPFRRLSPRQLLIPVLLLLAIATYKQNAKVLDYKEQFRNGRQAELLLSQHHILSKEQNSALETWHNLNKLYRSNGIMKTADDEKQIIQTANFAKLFAYVTDKNIKDESIGFYDREWYDILIFVFAGIALFKSGFLTGKHKNSTYLLIAAIGIGLSFTYNYFELRKIYHFRFDAIAILDHTSFRAYDIRRILQTLGYLSVLILLYKIIAIRKILNRFAPVGQMAFTNYLSQSIIMATIFYGFKYYGKLQRYQIYEVVGVIWIFQIIFSTIWMKYFLFGPFEWLWRSLTYLKAQPFLKMKKLDLPQPLVEPIRVFAD
ncbi:MAG: DUF418 domain-containing protein [Ginsengibacter sp.]